MNDLISRQKAIDAVYERIRQIGYENNPLVLSIRQAIRDLDSVQPERKTGKWIVDALADNIYRCSECGIDAPVEPTGGTEYKSNYCQNCGAYMRERRTE